MVTMSDIARKAGVSRATVSYVLNGRHGRLGISQETCRHILELAADLNYRPNELARAMATGKNRVLGFLTGGPDYEPTARMLTGVIQEAGRHNYFVKVFHVQQHSFDPAIVENAVKLRLSGLIVSSLHDYVDKATLHEQLRQEVERNNFTIPTVGTNMYVYSNDRQGLGLAVEHLSGLGHRRIAFLAGVPNARISVAREQRWREAMADAELAVPDGYVAYGAWEMDPTEQDLRTLLQHPVGPPTAVCCVTDRAAFMALGAARRLGLRVPQDLSIVGYGGLSVTEWSDPPLTTVAQPFELMGGAAVRLLLKSLTEPESIEAGPDMRPTELLPSELRDRGSTASPSS